MPTGVEADRARRYLLRTLSEGEEERLEREYVESADVLDQVTAAEEALIDDYLDAELPSDERKRFEEVYLSSSAKRRRVDTIRRLRMARNTHLHPHAALRPPAAWRRYVPLAAAAALVVIAALLITWRARDTGRSTAAPENAAQSSPAPTERPSPGSAAPGAPAARIVALALSPIATRSPSTSQPLVIPSGTDAVELDLVVESSPASATRVDLATVAGLVVWSGAPAPLAGRNAVRVQVTASQLPPNDYIVTLYGRSPSGREAEQHRYFLRVRAQ
jgi:anti-sigma factor RsiW